MSPVEVITSVQRRRRWTAEQKKAMVEEAEQPGNSISSVARKYEVQTLVKRIVSVHKIFSQKSASIHIKQI